MVDLSKVSNEDLIAYDEGRYADISDEGLLIIDSARSQASSPKQKPIISQEAETPEDKGYDLNRARSLAFKQGLLYDFADELSGGLAAMDAVMPGGESPKEAYVRSRDEARNLEKQYGEEHPIEKLSLEMAGAVPSMFIPGIGVFRLTKGMGMIPKIASRFGAGALAGGVQGLGSAEGDITDQMKSAGKSAMVGGALNVALGALLPAAGKASKSVGKTVEEGKAGWSARSLDEIESKFQSMKTSAGAKFEQSRKIGAIFTEKTSKGIPLRITKAAQGTSSIDPLLHPGTNKILKDLRKEASSGVLTLNELHKYKQLLSDVIDNGTEKLTGKMDADAQRALAAKNELNAIVKGLTEKNLIGGKKGVEAVKFLKEASDEWFAMSKFDDMSRLIRKATDVDGFNPDKFRKLIFDFTKNRGNLAGYTREELKAMLRAGKIKGTERVLDWLSMFSLNEKSPLKMLSHLAGLGAVGTVGTPATAVTLGVAGTAAKKGKELVGKGKAEKILQAIEK